MTFIIIWTLIGGGWSSVAIAQESGIAINTEEVSSEFPDGLRFKITASTETPIDRANLLVAVGLHPTLYQSTVQMDEPTADIAIDYSLNLLNLGIPPGVELSYYWQFVGEDGSMFESEPRNAEWFDIRFDWQLTQTDDIHMYAYSGNDDFTLHAASIAQEAVDVHQDRLQAPERREPIKIWLYENQEDLSGALSPNSREWIGGVSYARFSLIAAVVAAGEERPLLRVVPHEVVHQIFHDATVNPFISPAAWLDEGLATHGQGAGTENFEEIVKVAFEDGSLPNLRSLISEWGSDRRSVDVSYAASHSIVSYITETYGVDAILSLTLAYRAGMSHDAVVQSVFGISLDELDAGWHSFIEDTVNS